MKAFSIALILLLSTSITFAQETPVPAPWPPDPSTIFAEGVEVVSVELVTQLAAIHTPVIDTVGRAVVMPDGRVFPWLDEIPYAWFYGGTDLMVNNTLFIAVSANSDIPTEAIWQLDTISGIYTRLESATIDTPCGPLELNPLPIGWILVSSHQLCNISTGIKTVRLPEDLRTVKQSIESSDGQMLLLLWQKSDNTNTTIISIYSMKTEHFEQIGQITQGEVFEFNGWVNNQTAVIKVRGNLGVNPKTGYPLIEYQAYLIIDVGYQDIKQFSSPRIIYHDRDGTPAIIIPESDNAEADRSCELTVYNILARTTVTYIIPSACYPEYSFQNNDYYREIFPDRTQSTLFQVNHLTGERSDLTQGEIEFVTWVSRDARYTVQVMDNSGTVDTPPAEFRLVHVSDAVLWLVDLETDRTLFTIPAYRDSFSGYWSPYVSHVTNDWIQIVHPWGSQTPNYLIWLDGDNSQIFPLEGVLSTYFGNGWVALRPQQVEDEFGSVASLGLYDLNTHKTIPILNIGNFSQYYLADQEFKSLGGNQFEIIVGYYDAFSDEQPEYPVARYTIRVPGVEIPVIP